MKRYIVSTIAVLVVLAVTLGLYAQPGGEAGGGARGGAGGARGGGMGRGFGGFVNPETVNAAVAAIEKELANVKKAMEIQVPMPEGGFQDMSEEDRTKMREAMQKRNEAMQSATAAIDQQLKVLKGGFQLRQELQTETDALQAIADSANKEKATETAKLINDLIAKKTKALEDTMEKLGIRGGRGGRMGGGGMGGRGGEAGGQQRRGGGQQ